MLSDPASIAPELERWVSDNVVDDFSKVLQLTNENKNDPPTEPYRSLYSAREFLSGIKGKMDSCPDELRAMEDFKIISSALRLHLGLNYFNTDELGRADEAFEASLRQLDGVSSKVKTASLSVHAYNHLGVLWGNRSEQQKALEYLLKSKAVYESHIALPPPITDSQWLTGESVSEWEREKAFESLHTHTLFYLAQVFGNLKQVKQSAHYCQTTLSRQLEMKEYDAIEWSLNCATLSQYYISTEQFAQARHCLAAATCMLEQYLSDSSSSDAESDPEGMLAEKIQQVKADISRCWIKYCLGLLSASKDKQELEEAQSEQPAAKRKLFKFEALEVADLEAAVPCDLIESFDGAKPVFFFCQKQIEAAKEYYTLNSFASDSVSITQDHSQLYKLVAFFETAIELKCRMHKRRVDMLTALLQELNRQHFLNVCRQLLYEVAETQSEMASLKIVNASEDPSPHAVGKINKLLMSGVKYFENFVNSFVEQDANELPDPISEDYLRPILCAKLHIARLHSKVIYPDPAVQVRVCFLLQLMAYLMLIIPLYVVVCRDLIFKKLWTTTLG